jgi:cytochrome c peroxidase
MRSEPPRSGRPPRILRALQGAYAALRGAFYHNGAVHSLRDAVAFYATRDSAPERWYPRRADGTVAKFDDLPERYRANIDNEAPFGRKPGDPAALSNQKIDDIGACLQALADGYTPPRPATVTARKTPRP